MESGYHWRSSQQPWLLSAPLVCPRMPNCLRLLGLTFAGRGRFSVTSFCWDSSAFFPCDVSHFRGGGVEPALCTALPSPFWSQPINARSASFSCGWSWAVPVHGETAVSSCQELTTPPDSAHGAEGAAPVSRALPAACIVQSELSGSEQLAALWTYPTMGQNTSAQVASVDSADILTPPVSQLQHPTTVSQALVQHPIPASASAPQSDPAVSPMSSVLEPSAHLPVPVPQLSPIYHVEGPVASQPRRRRHSCSCSRFLFQSPERGSQRQTAEFCRRRRHCSRASGCSGRSSGCVGRVSLHIQWPDLLPRPGGI